MITLCINQAEFFKLCRFCQLLQRYKTSPTCLAIRYRNDNLAKKHSKYWNDMFYNQSHVQCSREMAEHNDIVPFYCSHTVITNMVPKTHNLASASWLLALYLLTTIWRIVLCNLCISAGAMEMSLWNTMYHHIPTCVLLVWWHPIPDQLGQSLKYIYI